MLDLDDSFANGHQNTNTSRLIEKHPARNIYNFHQFSERDFVGQQGER